MIAGQFVDGSEKVASLEIDRFVSPFEVIEFLEHGDGDRNVVFFEVLNAAAVVQNHIRVEHE
jgi:hypothetical protein